MDLENNLITADKRVATSDARFDMRLTENFDDDASSTGWTWVAAILIAAAVLWRFTRAARVSAPLRDSDRPAT